MSQFENIICLFVVSAGQNGENLGSDEEEIVVLSYFIVNIHSRQIIKQNAYYIVPENRTKPIITEECQILTGYREEIILTGCNLRMAINNFEDELNQLNMKQENSIILTDGQLHIRMSLIPELTRKNIEIPTILESFLDLRKAFKSCHNVQVINCLNEMLKFIDIDKKSIKLSNDYALDQCMIMSTIIIHLLTNDTICLNPENINTVYEIGICNKSDIIEENTIIRARGLPWQATEQDIFVFLSGLNIYKGGIALCLSNNGRRNGEALIRFVSKEHRDLALRKHKHHIGHRYIEIYKANVDEFINIVTSDSDQANMFLSRQIDRNQIIIRMRGLPFSCTAQEVITFFSNEPNSVRVLDDEGGILFVQNAEGKSTGDAFVLFASEQDAGQALLKHRLCIGTRYVELFRSSSAEVQQVLNKFSDTEESVVPVCVLQKLKEQTELNPYSGENINNFNNLTKMDVMPNLVLIKSMPIDVNISDILLFLGEFCKFVVYQGIHLIYNHKGISTGEALIQFDSEYNARFVANAKNKKIFFTKKNKYIVDVFLYAEYDENHVNFVLEDSIQRNYSIIQDNSNIENKIVPNYMYQYIYYIPQTFIKVI